MRQRKRFVPKQLSSSFDVLPVMAKEERKDELEIESIEKFGWILKIITYSFVVIATLLGLEHIYMEKPGSAWTRPMFGYFVAILSCILRHFYLMNGHQTKGVSKSVHIFCRTHGPQILVMILSVMGTETTIKQSPDSFMFSTS